MTSSTRIMTQDIPLIPEPMDEHKAMFMYPREVTKSVVTYNHQTWFAVMKNARMQRKTALSSAMLSMKKTNSTPPTPLVPPTETAKGGAKSSNDGPSWTSPRAKTTSNFVSGTAAFPTSLASSTTFGTPTSTLDPDDSSPDSDSPLSSLEAQTEAGVQRDPRIVGRGGIEEQTEKNLVLRTSGELFGSPPLVASPVVPSNAARGSGSLKTVFSSSPPDKRAQRGAPTVDDYTAVVYHFAKSTATVPSIPTLNETKVFGTQQWYESYKTLLQAAQSSNTLDVLETTLDRGIIDELKKFYSGGSGTGIDWKAGNLRDQIESLNSTNIDVIVFVSLQDFYERCKARAAIQFLKSSEELEAALETTSAFGGAFAPLTILLSAVIDAANTSGVRFERCDSLEFRDYSKFKNKAVATLALQNLDEGHIYMSVMRGGKRRYMHFCAYGADAVDSADIRKGKFRLDFSDPQFERDVSQDNVACVGTAELIWKATYCLLAPKNDEWRRVSLPGTTVSYILAPVAKSLLLKITEGLSRSAEEYLAVSSSSPSSSGKSSAQQPEQPMVQTNANLLTRVGGAVGGFLEGMGQAVQKRFDSAMGARVVNVNAAPTTPTPTAPRGKVSATRVEARASAPQNIRTLRSRRDYADLNMRLGLASDSSAGPSSARGDGDDELAWPASVALLNRVQGGPPLLRIDPNSMRRLSFSGKDSPRSAAGSSDDSGGWSELGSVAASPVSSKASSDPRVMRRSSPSRTRQEDPETSSSASSASVFGGQTGVSTSIASSTAPLLSSALSNTTMDATTNLMLRAGEGGRAGAASQPPSLFSPPSTSGLEEPVQAVASFPDQQLSATDQAIVSRIDAVMNRSRPQQITAVQTQQAASNEPPVDVDSVANLAVLVENNFVGLGDSNETGVSARKDYVERMGNPAKLEPLDNARVEELRKALSRKVSVVSVDRAQNDEAVKAAKRLVTAITSGASAKTGKATNDLVGIFAAHVKLALFGVGAFSQDAWDFLNVTEGRLQDAIEIYGLLQKRDVDKIAAAVQKYANLGSRPVDITEALSKLRKFHSKFSYCVSTCSVEVQPAPRLVNGSEEVSVNDFVNVAFVVCFTGDVIVYHAGLTNNGFDIDSNVRSNLLGTVLRRVLVPFCDLLCLVGKIRSRHVSGYPFRFYVSRTPIDSGSFLRLASEVSSMFVEGVDYERTKEDPDELLESFAKIRVDGEQNRAAPPTSVVLATDLHKISSDDI
jgi:hypothetical protein